MSMIDESLLRVRYEALRSSLDERGRRLSAAAEAKAAGYGGIAAAARATKVARSTIGRGLKDLRDPGSLDGKGAAQGRRQPSVDDEGPDAAGGPATIARAGDDGRSDAAVAMGLQEPRQAGDGASRDGSQGKFLDHSQAIGGAQILSSFQPQDQGRRQTSRSRRPVFRPPMHTATAVAVTSTRTTQGAWHCCRARYRRRM